MHFASANHRSTQVGLSTTQQLSKAPCMLLPLDLFSQLSCERLAQHHHGHFMGIQMRLSLVSCCKPLSGTNRNLPRPGSKAIRRELLSQNFKGTTWASKEAGFFSDWPHDPAPVYSQVCPTIFRGAYTKVSPHRLAASSYARLALLSSVLLPPPTAHGTHPSPPARQGSLSCSDR